MNIAEIKELIDKIENSNISLFELKLGDDYLKMDKSELRNSVPIKSDKEPIDKSLKETFKKEIDNSTNDSEKIIKNDSEKIAKEENVENLQVIKSPMVGTFYKAPGNNLKAFVEEGQSVKIGDTLCIIEAMKLMNEIESEIDGEIISILVNDGDMVEYGEPLFKVRRN